MKAPQSLAFFLAIICCATGTPTVFLDAVEQATSSYQFVRSNQLQRFKSPLRLPPVLFFTNAVNNQPSVIFLRYYHRKQKALESSGLVQAPQSIDYTLSPRVINGDFFGACALKFYLEQNQQISIFVHGSGGKRPTPQIATRESDLHKGLKATFSNGNSLEIHGDGVCSCTLVSSRWSIRSTLHTECVEPPAFVTVDGLTNRDYMIQVWNDKTVVVIEKKISEGKLIGQFFSMNDKQWYDLPALEDITAESVVSIYATKSTTVRNAMGLMLIIKPDSEHYLLNGKRIYYYKRFLRLTDDSVMEREWNLNYYLKDWIEIQTIPLWRASLMLPLGVV